MDMVCREEQVSYIAGKLGLNKTLVARVLYNYISYLQDRISEGRTIKFLNICYLRTNGSLENREEETLAYISTEIGSYLGVGGTTVLRILQDFENQIVDRLIKDRGYSVRGLVRIRLEQGNKIRIKKSTIYNGEDVYIITLGSFRKKFESLEQEGLRDAG